MSFFTDGGGKKFTSQSEDPDEDDDENSEVSEDVGYESYNNFDRDISPRHGEQGYNHIYPSSEVSNTDNALTADSSFIEFSKSLVSQYRCRC